MYWIVLIVGAVLALAYVVVKIRHNQLTTADAVFWFLFALALIVMAVFPQIVYACSAALGFESPSNFVFLCMLAIVIFRQLTVSVELAAQRNQDLPADPGHRLVPRNRRDRGKDRSLILGTFDSCFRSGAGRVFRGLRLREGPYQM